MSFAFGVALFGNLGPQRSGVEEERRGFGLDVTILTKRRGGGPVVALGPQRSGVEEKTGQN